jgi:acyl-coenzyme A synthetase/AMP-(fatty) acid ligase
MLSEFPKNPSGKILKRVLRQRFGDMAEGAAE